MASYLCEGCARFDECKTKAMRSNDDICVTSANQETTLIKQKELAHDLPTKRR